MLFTRWLLTGLTNVRCKCFYDGELPPPTCDDGFSSSVEVMVASFFRLLYITVIFQFCVYIFRKNFGKFFIFGSADSGQLARKTSTNPNRTLMGNSSTLLSDCWSCSIADEILALHPWNKYFGGRNAHWDHSSPIRPSEASFNKALIWRNRSSKNTACRERFWTYFLAIFILFYFYFIYLTWK